MAPRTSEQTNTAHRNTGGSGQSAFPCRKPAGSAGSMPAVPGQRDSIAGIIRRYRSHAKPGRSHAQTHLEIRRSVRSDHDKPARRRSSSQPEVGGYVAPPWSASVATFPLIRRSIWPPPSDMAFKEVGMVSSSRRQRFTRRASRSSAEIEQSCDSAIYCGFDCSVVVEALIVEDR